MRSPRGSGKGQKPSLARSRIACISSAVWMTEEVLRRLYDISKGQVSNGADQTEAGMRKRMHAAKQQRDTKGID